MAAWLWLGVRLGIPVGIVSGFGVGLITAVGGGLFTSTLPDLALVSVNGFWGIAVASPVLFYLSFFSIAALMNQRDAVHDHLHLITLGAVLPACLIGLVTFMMPVVMMPILLGRGVTFEGVTDWYNQVYTPLVGGRGLAVGACTLLGYGLAAYLVRLRYRP
jgi:hypothetical protein